MGFLVRIVQVVFLVLLYIGLIAGVSAALYYGLKVLWLVFEHLFHDQAEWFKSHFGLLSPVKNCSTIIITVVAILAVIVSIWFAFLAGQGSQGELFP